MRYAKTSITLPEVYIEKLKRGARKLGITQSEFMRRAIDEYLYKINQMIASEKELKRSEEQESSL